MKPAAKTRLIQAVAGLAGFTAVGLGAFGAHAMRDVFRTLDTEDVWRTASTYHFIHTIALLVVAVLYGVESRNYWLPRIAFCWTIGILLFSGSLYILAVGGSPALGPITPIGGLCLMAGWAMLVPAAHVHHELEEKHQMDD